VNSSVPLGDTHGSSRFRNLLGLLLGGVAVVTYLPACRNDFVNWDDPIYVTTNRHVAAGLTSTSIRYAWTTFDSANWIPLTWLSYELDATLFGVNATAFHATNVILHAVNVWLLYLVLKGMTGAVVRSALVALLFAIHPLHVESVAWISERKDVLSTGGLLLTLLAYRRYAAQPTTLRYALVCGAYSVGLLAKSMLVTLPLLLLLVDFWPLQRIGCKDEGEERTDDSNADLRRSLVQLFVEKLPLLALAFIDGLVTLAAQQSAMEPLAFLTVPYRIGNALCAYGWYLWKTAWPTGLCTLYQHPFEDLSLRAVVGATVGLILMTVYVTYWASRRRHLVFGWLWFLIALFPVIGLIQVGLQAYADRYSYIPHIGLFVLIVWEGHYWSSQSRIGRWAGIGLSTAFIAMFLWQTTAQIATWRDSDSMWSTVLEVDPYNPVAHKLLGEMHERRELWKSAQQHYELSMVRSPADSMSVMQLGKIHQNYGNWDFAAAYYRWMLRKHPQYQAAVDALAKLPAGDRQVDKQPVSTAVNKTRLGLQHARRGETQQALTLFQEAAVIDPEYGLALTSAAFALEKLGRRGEAGPYYEQALRADPFNVEAIHGLDRILKLTAAQ